jgi:hypothetical protein
VKRALLFHPVWQSLSLCVGIYNAFMGITRKGFTLKQHQRVGLAYYGMTSGGFIGGYIVATRRHVDMDVHLITGIIILILFVIAGALGFRMLAEPARIVSLRPFHKWINLTSLVLFLFQGVYGYFFLFTL